jgi:dihydroorotate dehydrogenase
MDLTTHITPRLTLRDPFMIGASHWTGSEASFRQLATYSPSAITLKTVSLLKGGDGTAITSRRRIKLEDAHGNFFGVYVDGPQTIELIEPVTAYQLTKKVKDLLPQTAFGLSVLQGEDYQEVAKMLDLSDYSYVELNFKYSFRSVDFKSLPDFLSRIEDDLRRFLEVFRALPVLVKFSREATALVGLMDFGKTLEVISQAQAGVIIANSKRLRVPPSRTPTGILSELSEGVVVGEYLLFDTYNTIALLERACETHRLVLPIVASGGVVDIGGVVDVFAAGACAVQLCTAIDTLGVHVLPLFRQQLQRLGPDAGSLSDFVATLRADRSAWKEAATRAREFRVDEEKTVDAALADDATVLDFIGDALVQECKDIPTPVWVTENDAIPEGMRFVLSMGSAASFLISSHIIEDCSCTPLLFDTAGDFCRKMADSAFEWDFALLPDSSLAYLSRQKQNALGARAPVVVGHALRSVFELVGSQGLGLKDVRHVYHFEGNSSRAALSQLLKACHPIPIPLWRSKLLPLLQFWEEGSAILAKPPLTRIYGALSSKELKSKWGVVWTTSEPIMLAASRRFLERAGGEAVASAVRRKVEESRQGILANPERAARRARSEGFLRFCRKLLLTNDAGK